MNEKGVALTEYAVIIGFVFIIVIGALILFGEELTSYFQFIIDRILSFF